MSQFRFVRFLVGITAVFIHILGINYAQPRPSLAANTPLPLSDELYQDLQRYGEIPIIITLDVPSHRAWQASGLHGSPDVAQMERISQEITQTADDLLSRLAKGTISQIKRYDYFPLLAMTVDEAALENLAADKAVTNISLDKAFAPAMDDTIPLIGANNNHFLNYTGSGWSIAILDTGVQKAHPALMGKVISEACYSSNLPHLGITPLCPGGGTSSTAVGSGVNCLTGISGCDHGTHVAGIAARVAPQASIIAIQVFSRFSDVGGNTPCQDINRTSPCTRAQYSDIISGLNRVWGLHVGNPNINVAAVNMSLGGGFYSGPCDHLAEFNGVRLAINQLRDQNVATVASAGNSGYRNGMGAPACLTSTISVAASDKSDQVASFSNISVFTTLIAPGTPILAPVPTTLTPIYQSRGGTSMAAPHVAGAIATLKEGQPNATVPTIITTLTSSGPSITDQRSGGFITKRRLNTWSALCQLLTCDSDDFRTLGTNQTINGSISPARDVDHYYYYGTAGQRLTLRMNRTSGSHDPYLELFSPSGHRVAFNDNGGGGVNALINGYLLPQTGSYQIRARSMNNFTGNYQIITSTQAETLNPVPQISYLSPGWTYGSFFGSDFWVAIYGNNFMPESQVRINGQLRAKFYSSPTLIYIRVLAGDIYWPWPRNAFITVVNPTPGGGTSNSRTLPIYAPFLGESSMIYPETESSVSVGISQTFAISWTAPITTGTWRDMQYMDMRLRNEVGEVAAWVRVVERPNDEGGSFYRLLNASEEMVGEGLPGEDLTLVLTDTVSLHLADSLFSGSGLTAIMTPTLTFGPAAIGTYNVEFRVDSVSGTDEDPNAQDGDVLGVFTILPEGCGVALGDVVISGDSIGEVGAVYPLITAVSPINASIPITYTWVPEPDNGQGFPNAAYSFAQAGEYLIMVQAENCGAFAAAWHTIRISSGPDPDLSIGKIAPATAVSDQPLPYTLTITNSGAMTATNLLIRDTLPTGATHLSGGTLVGNEVQWSVAELGGYGQTAVVSFTVSTNSHLVNTMYSVLADGGFGSQGNQPVETRLVDAQVAVTAVTTGTLTYNSSNGSSQLIFPGGSVFADTIITYDEITIPATWGDTPHAGRAFHLDLYQNNRLMSNQTLYETAHITLSYKTADLNGINPNSLTLYYWHDNQWHNDGIHCTTNSPNQTVYCQVNTPPQSSYVLASATHTLMLPLIINQFPPTLPYAQINDISISGEAYAATFQTYGFVPQMPGQHVHFFFNTVPPEEAGLPGSGPWYVYAGPSPFTGYNVTDRPSEATHLCILVANADHSVIQGTGNCYPLPNHN